MRKAGPASAESAIATEQRVPEFMPGLALARVFYEEGVKPILEARFPRLPYAAALIGWGSEVLGYDTPRSTDHNWGPRLLLFLTEDDFETAWPAVDVAVRQDLPLQIRGYATNFARDSEIAERWLVPVAQGPIDHMVQASTVPDYLLWYLGHDLRGDITAVDWLTFSEHKLLTLTAGEVFHDGLGELRAMRQRLAYYPRDVWLWMLAAQWGRIGEEEAFMGRCGDVGDDLGSRLVAARLVRDLMRLAFLMERTYPPYSKWFGAAFARLTCAPRLQPSLEAALAATDWHERETHLVRACEIVAEMHNALGITAPIAPRASPYHERPYQTIHAERFSDAIQQQISDETVRILRFDLGAIDQWVDAPDKTANVALARRLRRVYQDG